MVGRVPRSLVRPWALISRSEPQLPCLYRIGWCWDGGAGLMGFPAHGKGPPMNVHLPPRTSPHPRLQPVHSPGPLWRLRSRQPPPLPFIPDRKAQLGDWTWGFGADVCELAGGWESGDLLPGLTAACSSPAPHPPPSRRPGPPTPELPPTRSRREGARSAEVARGLGEAPPTTSSEIGPHWELLKTPDLFSPFLCLRVEGTKVEWNQGRATSGAAVGPQHPSHADGTQGRDMFWEPAGRKFLKPFGGGRPQGEPQPELL